MRDLYNLAKSLEQGATGYQFGGIDDGVVFYAKRGEGYKFSTMYLFPCDLTPSNFAFMCKHGLTRDEESVRKHQKAFRKKARAA